MLYQLEETNEEPSGIEVENEKGQVKDDVLLQLE